MMKNKLLGIFLIIFLSLNINSRALEKSTYYSEQLKDLGLNLISFNKAKKIYKVDTNKALLAVSSELNDSNILKDLDFNSIYIICDKEFTFEDIKCDTNKINNKNIEKVGSNDLSSINYIVINISNKNVIIIPERYFIAPIYNKNLELLFKKTQNKGSLISNNYIETSPLQQLKESSYIELCLTILTTLFSILLISKILVSLSNKSIKNIFNEIKSKLIDFANENIWIYQNIAMIMFIVMFIVMFSLSLSYLIYMDFNITPFLGYFSNSDSIYDIKNKLSKNFLFIPALFIILFSIMILSIIFIYDLYLLKVKDNLYKFNLNKILIFIISFIYLSLFMNYYEYSKYQFFNIVLACFLFIIIIYNKEILKLSFDKNKIIIIFIILFIVNLAGGIILYKKFLNSNNVTFSNLFNRNDVKLPYFKTNNKNIRYQKLFFNEDKNIFINNYLIFSPSFNSITNKNISDFRKGINENFYIVSIDKNSIIKEYLKNYDLVSSISSPSSNFYYLRPQTEKIYFNIEYKCEEIKKPFLISVNYYYFEDKLNVKKQDLMNYTGCNYTNILSYEIPFEKLEYNKPSIFELTSVPSNFINISVVTENQKLNLIPLIVNEGVIAKQFKNENSKSINVYSPEIKYEINFNRSNDNKFNLAYPINNLLDLELINSNFTIWSDKLNDNFIYID